MWCLTPYICQIAPQNVLNTYGNKVPISSKIQAITLKCIEIGWNTKYDKSTSDMTDFMGKYSHSCIKRLPPPAGERLAAQNF